MKDRILITLATGKTGYAATVQLLEEGYPVRIYVRSKNEKALALEKMGAEIAIGEFDNYEQLKIAMMGIDKVYYCYPYKAGMPKDIELFISVAKETTMNAVVFMGQRIADFDDTGSSLSNDIRKCYKLLENSGLDVVYFLPGYFADNVFVVTEFAIQLGLLPNTFGNGKNPWISIDDMARCIVALLKNPEPYFGQRIYPTGSKSISAKEIAAIFSKVSGRKVRIMNTPEWLFLKFGIMMGEEFGFDKFAIIQATYYNRQMQINRFDIPPNDTVKSLTGKDPEDFETITKGYFNKSKYRNRSISNWFAAFKKFNLLPFIKVPNKKEREAINR